MSTGRTKNEPFECLSDDLVANIAGFLRVRDLVALRQCNVKLDGVCGRRDLWNRLVAIDFEVSDEMHNGGLRSLLSAYSSISARLLSLAISEQPYSVYKRYFQAHLEKKRQHIRRDESRASAQKVRE